MLQLILHGIGDYITQSHWMASEKTKRHWPAFVHALVYSIPFWLLSPSWEAWFTIFGTHFLIDRYRLARLVVKWKNVIGDSGFWGDTNQSIREKVIPRYDTGTGYPEDSPAWLSVWLLIAADNFLHLTINWLALNCL